MEMMNDDETDWSDLSFDLLAQITDKVISYSLADYVRFGCICVQWRSFLIENYEDIKLSNLPVLLIPSYNHRHHSNYKKQPGEEDIDRFDIYNYYNPKEIWLGLDHNQRHRGTRSFYSIFDRKVYNDFQLSVPSYMNCRGSSHGWLVTIEECGDGTYSVQLMNPFRSEKNNKIQLPPLIISDELNYSYFMRKAIFSGDPSSLLIKSIAKSDDDYYYNDDKELVVLCLYDTCEMGFCRPGDGTWTPLPNQSHVYDVLCYKGQFWGILQNGAAVAFDIAPEPKCTIVVDPHQDDFPYPSSRYLVESTAGGDLFQVRRDIHIPDDDGYSTVGFQAFKLDPAAMQWVKMDTLDGCMFFLGENASMSFFVADCFPGWFKPNSIYFTDDYYAGYNTNPWEGPHDMGVFNLEDGSFEPHYTMESKAIMPAPIWIQPML